MSVLSQIGIKCYLSIMTSENLNYIAFRSSDETAMISIEHVHILIDKLGRGERNHRITRPTFQTMIAVCTCEILWVTEFPFAYRSTARRRCDTNSGDSAIGNRLPDEVVDSNTGVVQIVDRIGKIIEKRIAGVPQYIWIGRMSSEPRCFI